MSHPEQELTQKLKQVNEHLRFGRINSCEDIIFFILTKEKYWETKKYLMISPSNRDVQYPNLNRVSKYSKYVQEVVVIIKLVDNSILYL